MSIPAPSIEAVPASTPVVERKRVVLGWAKKGGAAILDQALYAGANFAINIMLARWLPQQEYGSFAVVYAVLTFFLTLHTALISEPMVIFGSGRFGELRLPYFRFLLKVHVMGIAPAIAFATVAVVSLVSLFSSSSLIGAFYGLAVAVPFALILWTLRRMAYVVNRPIAAVLGSGSFLFLLFLGAIFLHRAEHLSALSALVLMGVASLCGGVTTLVMIPLAWHGRPAALETHMVVREHWRYGRWAVGSAACIWISMNLYYLALAGSHGLAEVGSLRAVMNLANPGLQTLVALTLVLLPALSIRYREGWPSMKRLAAGALFLFPSGMLLYAGVLWVGRHQLFTMIYNGRYSVVDEQILFVGAIVILAGFTSALGSILRASERPALLFWVYLASALAALAVGLPLTMKFGTSGALAGMAFSYMLTMVGMFTMCQSVKKRAGNH